MKRILTALLLLALVAATGCGADANPSSNADSSAPAATAATASAPPSPLPTSLRPSPSPTAPATPSTTADPYAGYAGPGQAALDFLLRRLSDARECVYVYHDFAATENHFTQKAKIFGGHEEYVRDMDENWTQDAFAGASCIRCDVATSGQSWGGWMFLNGYLPEGESAPKLNDGTAAGQGLDLTGAQALSFFAKGEKGGEVVEFFTAGFGYDGERGAALVLYPDSAQKQSLGFVTLSDHWEEYVIPLSGLDLSSIACGFGFVCSGAQSGGAGSVFYLDEIRFTGSIGKARTAPVLLRSYDTDNVYLQNAAFSYDNALAAMAFLCEGLTEEAAQILDAFVYAVQNDRHAPGRVRNAYAAGDISPFPGWESGGARLPGWYDAQAGAYLEDRYQVGCNVGNTSYVAIALLQYDSLYGQPVYLDAAKTLMDWVIDTCSDATPGFTAGYDGWPEGDAVYPFTYKSIEHNIDAYAAFAQLYARTGETRYRDAADSALAFVRSMYDETQGYFLTGTGDDGITPSRGNVVLDAQVWSALALGQDFTPYEKALDLVASMRTGGAYPFCQSNANGGWWAEGTAYTALLYRLRGEDGAAAAALDALCGIQLASGAFPAATVENLSTGFYLFDGSPWEYGSDAHIAPAAWFVMALNGFNPYAF